MHQVDIERIEMELFLEAIRKRYGYDFMDYSVSSLERRLQNYKAKKSVESLVHCVPEILRNRQSFYEVVNFISVPVSEMFRDPEFYSSVRKHIIPVLRSYPLIKIWAAGCATGEEGYSLAILLAEEGLLERSTLYATDINKKSLRIAEEGIYPAGKLESFKKNYQMSGANGDFSDYFSEAYGHIKVRKFLKERICFSCHNLVNDAPFGEMHVVVCRNVFIYFNPALQSKIVKKFSECLVRKCFLCLGSKENLVSQEDAAMFSDIDPRNRIFRSKK